MVWVLWWTILGFVAARAVLSGERLALLEALAAIFIVPIAFTWARSFWRTVAPYLGIVVIFIGFAAAEYIRSWQYYKQFYDTYYEFITVRFIGYFSTSVNNGAGTYLMYAADNPEPDIMVGWVTRFPGLTSYFSGDEPSLLHRYLATWASPEFNNPGGLYAAFLDFPFLTGTVVMVGLGFVIGVTYQSFLRRRIFGMVLYPLLFLGITDLIRIVYMTDTRSFPIFVGTILVTLALRPTYLPASWIVRAGDGAQPVPGRYGTVWTRTAAAHESS
jgi:hypothetical protein